MVTSTRHNSGSKRSIYEWSSLQESKTHLLKNRHFPLRAPNLTLGHYLLAMFTYSQAHSQCRPPRSSPYSTGYEYDQITRDLIYINTRYNCRICLICDFNSSTGSLLDFLEAVYECFLEAVGLHNHEHNLFVDRHMLQQLDIPAHRYSSDKLVDDNGKILLDPYVHTGMVIVNGRTGAKESSRVTCKGASIVDYALASTDLFQYINAFQVDIFDRCLSDVHCPISLELNKQPCTETPVHSYNEPNPTDTTQPIKTPTFRTLWDPNKKTALAEAFNIMNINALTDHLDSLQHSDMITQPEIYQLTASIEGVYKDTGEKAGVIKPLYRAERKRPSVTTKIKKHTRKTNNKPWFSIECIQKRKDFFLAKRKYKNNHTTNNKLDMNLESETFRKTTKLAYRNYHRELQSTQHHIGVLSEPL